MIFSYGFIGNSFNCAGNKSQWIESFMKILWRFHEGWEFITVFDKVKVIGELVKNSLVERGEHGGRILKGTTDSIDSDSKNFKEL